jgi:hypothetical protein
MRLNSLPLLALTFLLGSLPDAIAQENSNESDITYILNRYIKSMGGRANLQKIRSIRMEGDLIYADGTSHKLTVLKKKPNLVRITLDTGTLRIIQAYDGKDAWFAREQGNNLFIDRMRGQARTTFLIQAPIENILIDKRDSGAEIELLEDVEFVRVPCYQIEARFPDGSRIIHCINKETYLEHRILQYNREGELASEIVPSNFEFFDGILFSMNSKVVADGEEVSSLVIEEVQTNIGVLDSAFSPPTELPEE